MFYVLFSRGTSEPSACVVLARSTSLTFTVQQENVYVKMFLRGIHAAHLTGHCTRL
jgi:hypothetical protein